MRALLGGLAGLLLLATPAWAADEGERLFIQKGCIGCHGVGAHGGAGPDLANTPLSVEQLKQQVRSPRGQMPPFPAANVTDDQLQKIHAYLKSLTAKRDKLTEPPKGEQTAASCVECHRKANPILVAQYQSSAMFKPGRQNPRIPPTTPEANSCAICHGTNHTEITHVKGRVSEKICAACHAEIYKEHVTDLGHSYGPGPANIGGNWDRNIKVPHYAQMPRKVMEMGCDPCHAQAGATDEPYWDPAKKQYTDLSSLT